MVDILKRFRKEEPKLAIGKMAQMPAAEKAPVEAPKPAEKIAPKETHKPHAEAAPKPFVPSPPTPLKPAGEPRIGVYVCKCGLNIAGTVDCDGVAEYAGKLGNVVYSTSPKYTCSDLTQEQIQKDVKKYNLDKVIVAACSPNLHEKTFRKTVMSADLNMYQFEMANIREHCSWVHVREQDKATEKAKDLVKIAVAKARLIEPLPTSTVPVTKRVLVVGGGVAGMQAALDLANQGHEVVLVERKPTIGGVMAQLDKTFPTMDCSICIEGPMMSDVGKHEKIKLLTYHEVKSLDGYVGNFKARIEKKARHVDTIACNGCGLCFEVCPVQVPSEFDMGLGTRGAIYRPFPQAVPNKATLDKEHCINCGLCELVCEPNAIRHDDKPEEFELDVGAVVLATGFDVYDPSAANDYHYLDYANVITGMEMERLMNASGPTLGHVIRPSDGKEPKRYGYILCVGTRDRGKDSYCSGGVCCMYTLKQASMMKEKHPEDEIYVFYIDIRSTGKGFEELYTRARNAGIKFIRGKPGEIREDPATKKLVVTVENSLAGAVDDIELDMVILSTGMLPKGDAVAVGRTFHVSRSAEGFFLEKHPKLAPVDTATDGVFLAGACQGPKDIPNSVVQARGTAMASANLVTAGKITLGGDIAYHFPENCTGCGRCTKACAYGAWGLVELNGQAPQNAKGKPRKKIAKLTQALCKGCGTCAAECRDDAIEMKHFTDMQIISQIDAALEENAGEKVLAMLCNWCSYGGADNAGVSRMQYPTNARVIRVMCTGRVNEKFIEHAFDKGAGMVLVSGCHEGDCHYIHGNKFMTRREKKIREMMQEKGIADHRFRLEWISASEGAKFQRVMTEMADVLMGKVAPPQTVIAEAKAETNGGKNK